MTVRDNVTHFLREFKYMKKQYIIIIFLLFINSLVIAQNDNEAIKKYTKGIKYLVKEEYEKSLTCFKDAIKIDPSLTNKCKHELAKCYIKIGFDSEKKGDTLEAEKNYIQAIKYDSSNEKYYIHLASLYSSTGDNYNAIKLYESAILLGADENLYIKKIERLKDKKTKKDESEFSFKCPICDQLIPTDAGFCPYCKYKIERNSSKSKKRVYNKLELAFYYGSLGGSLSPLIGWTVEGEEIKVRVCGGRDFAIINNLFISPFLKIHTSFGYYSGGLNIKVNGVDGTFSRYPLRLGLLAQLNLGVFLNSFTSFYFGPAAGIHFNPTLEEDWLGSKTILNYRTAMGGEFIGGFIFYSHSNGGFFSSLGFRYLYYKYKYKDGISYGEKLVPGNTKHIWRELISRGIGFYVGIGVRI